MRDTGAVCMIGLARVLAVGLVFSLSVEAGNCYIRQMNQFNAARASKIKDVQRIALTTISQTI